MISSRRGFIPAEVLVSGQGFAGGGGAALCVGADDLAAVGALRGGRRPLPAEAYLPITSGQSMRKRRPAAGSGAKAAGRERGAPCAPLLIL